MQHELALEMKRMGYDPSLIQRHEILSSRHGHRVVRVLWAHRFLVLKTFPPDQTSEIDAYRLLVDHGVPTLPVRGMSEAGLLLEDLAVSPDWRAAGVQDMEAPATGRAVGAWYRKFHSVGLKITADPPSFIGREIDVVDADAIEAVQRMLGPVDDGVLRFAADVLQDLKEGLRSLPQTLNHNDFGWVNLALCRRGEARGIVYDYHQLGLGPACSDYRNVLTSLRGEAAEAFRTTYGEIPERHFVLDAPLATLHGLVVAASQPTLPGWAEGLVEEARDGRLRKSVEVALDSL